MATADEKRIRELIAQGEGLRLEFKSDVKPLPDRDLVAALVSLANTEGGDLLLGVEDDGRVTGVHASHANVAGLPALIANKTSPSLAVEVEKISLSEGSVVRVGVSKSRALVSTTEGLLQRRRLQHDGRPEAVPFYPHEFLQRQSSLGQVDPSAQPMPHIPLRDLSPLERQRVREAIARYRGDQSLLSLADDEFDGALGFTVPHEGSVCPSLAGVLFLAREETLTQHVCAHEVAFQVLDGTNVRVNEFMKKPLLPTFEAVEQFFKARCVEEEIEVGLFRVPIPNYDSRAFREAFVNALVHRDYTRLGAVHVRLDDDGLSVASPGGFVEGVTLANLLVVPPSPRNPRLADIVKRIGLAERTGRGIDRIYEGLLRYGRPAPDFSGSSSATVVVQMTSRSADLGFLRVILEHEERTGSSMPLDSLIVLSRLRDERRLDATRLAVDVQKSEAQVRGTLERLVEAGLIEPHGSHRGRTYTLSSQVYKAVGESAAYVRQAGFDAIQQEQMVLRYLDQYGTIRRKDVMELCRLTQDQAYKMLNKMKNSGILMRSGERKGASYVRKR